MGMISKNLFTKIVNHVIIYDVLWLGWVDKPANHRSREKEGAALIKKNCPYCKGESFSAYDNPHWPCPYCGRDIGTAGNELCSDNSLVYDSSMPEKQKADPQGSAIARKNIISIPLYTSKLVK